MTEKLTLTGAERLAAKQALRNIEHGDVSVGLLVDAVIAAINEERRPDPVGAVRRSPDGVSAIRIADNPYDDGPRWLGTSASSPGGSYFHPHSVVSRWPLVYTPEAS